MCQQSGNCRCRAVAAELVIFLPESVEEPGIESTDVRSGRYCRGVKHTDYRRTDQSKFRGTAAPGHGDRIWHPQDRCGADGCAEEAGGNDIIITKWIGLEGTADLAARNQEELLTRYPAYLVEEAAAFDRYYSILPEAATAVKSGGCTMHDISEGGVFAALWEMAEGAGVGLTIDMKKLPLRQETVEVCEFCNVNPYELRSGGSLIIASPEGTAVVEALAAEGIPAVIVGRFTDSNERLILNEDEIRYMDRPQRDEIYKSV